MNKIFNHILVPEIKLTDEIIDGKRFYTLPDGKTKLRSVTTIISEKSDKSALFAWKKRVGEKEANRITKKATTHGTAVHKIAERYLLNEADIKQKSMPTSVDGFAKIKKILDENVNDIMGIELPLFSTTLGCAGRTDVVAHYNGIPSIIDFKTSIKNKKEEWIQNYFIQSTVYSMMFESMYKKKIPQIVIIIAVEEENYPQIFIKNRSDYVNKVLEMFVG